MIHVPRGQETETSHKRTRRGTGNKRRKHLANTEDRRESWTCEERPDYATNTMTFAADIQNQSWNEAYTSTTFDKYKTTRRGTDNKLMKSLANQEDLRDIA